ncbi:MAG: orotidine-5'-phosphate decarboxylase [Terracidiphilus sp.]
MIAHGHSIFLDLKFHDIPNTVAGAVRSAASWGVRMMTVHSAGGPAMLAAAKAALDGIANPPELLAVTVLTSMDAAALESTGITRSPVQQVELLAKMGLNAGIRGFVCSPQEVAALRVLTGPDGVLVIPGIRPAGADTLAAAKPSAGARTDDQKRIATPRRRVAQRRKFPRRRPPHHAGCRSGQIRRSNPCRDGTSTITCPVT